ncbi:MAG: prepilin-type N-terminal cleavage/methylation domain-containing protein [Pseudohongiella sp.]|nr:prepilin-type N-terminal cleavage/methylation domain-containing protein [Pseudohongiella sp.]
MSNRPANLTGARGFTLLEVMIALTITAMVMGGLFTLSAGSKQLAVRAQQSLQGSTASRAAVNQALLDNEFRDFETAIQDDRYTIEGMDILPDAERRTAPMNDLLQRYEIRDSLTGEIIEAVRWTRSDLPQ